MEKYYGIFFRFGIFHAIRRRKILKKIIDSKRKRGLIGSMLRKNKRLFFRDIQEFGKVIKTDKWSVWIEFENKEVECFPKDLIKKELNEGKIIFFKK